MRSTQRENGLELARFLAALSVIYGHLVWSATYDTDLSFYIGSHAFPLTPSATHHLWFLQKAFGRIFWGAHVTIVGIAVFFMLTGWLTPDLLKRNSRRGYLINRFFRIFPSLLIATLALGCLQYFLHATAEFSVANVLETSTTTYRELHGTLLNGVVWTLAVELRFYLLCACVGTWTPRRLIGAGVLLPLVCYEATYLGGNFLAIAQDASYILFILCGMAWRGCIESEKRLQDFGILIILLISFNVTRSYDFLSRPVQNFTISNQVVTFVIFYICLKSSRYIGNWIQKPAALTYTLYLVHLVLGLAIIAFMQPIVGSSLAIGCAVACVFLVAFILRRSVEVPGIKCGKWLNQKFLLNKSSELPD